MFIYYYVHLDGSFETIERRLLRLLSSLDPMAAAAYREGEALRAQMRSGGPARPAVAKTVRFTVGRPLRGDAETEIPITWRATGTPGLFPAMEAGIIVAALGPELTQLALRGSYDPPLGAMGKTLDRAVLHRIAEACVKNFVDRIARAIEREADLDEVVRAGRTSVAHG